MIITALTTIATVLRKKQSRFEQLRMRLFQAVQLSPSGYANIARTSSRSTGFSEIYIGQDQFSRLSTTAIE